MEAYTVIAWLDTEPIVTEETEWRNGAYRPKVKHVRTGRACVWARNTSKATQQAARAYLQAERPDGKVYTLRNTAEPLADARRRIVAEAEANERKAAGRRKGGTRD